jgi:hypothetical protein
LNRRARSSARSEFALRRLFNQHLVGPRFDDPVEAVRWLGAVQSQDYPGAKWALAQRVNSIDSATLDRIFDRGDILRTHVMRPTWHFVTPADIRWMLALTASRVHAVMAPYDKMLELAGSPLKRSAGLLEKILRGGKHLTRNEIRPAMEKAGIPTRTPRMSHILMHAELDALICSGPLKGKQFTYALLDERVPATAPLARDEALARLAFRYFESHGPATVHDFSWWSGLRMGDAKEALELVKSRLVQETMDGVTYWLAPYSGSVRAAKPLMHLLPNYDEHIVAYRDHGPSFDPDSLGKADIRRGALLAHIVTRDGFVIGGWKRNHQPRQAEIKTDMLVSLTAAESKALKKQAEEYSRFIGLPVVLT